MARDIASDTTRDPAAPDLLELYRWSVQDPETHATVLRLMYERLHPGRTPTLLREDFAGTSAEAVAWLALGGGRRSIAVDVDGPTVAWAQARARRILGARAEALQFLEADVMTVAPPAVAAADILSVLNFSILYLRDEDALLAYLRHARQCVAAPGVLVLNLFGGPGALTPRVDRHAVTPRPRLPGELAIPSFEYLWEQRSFDPQTRHLDCRIHFRLPDPAGGGSPRKLCDAFRYDWRLWTPAELMAQLREAGFDEVQVWRHTYDASRGAAGVFLGAVPPSTLDSLELWTAYIVASRSPGP